MANDTYSDLNIFVGELSANELILDEESIRQSIMTILSTPAESRFFFPEFGSNLDRLLFDPFDDKTRFLVQRSVTKAINKWEPRVSLDRTEVTMDFESSSYYCSITYSIPALSNKSYSLAFSLRSRL